LASISKLVSVAVLCGAVMLLAFTAIPVGSGEDDAVHNVSAVHHSGPSDIPHGSHDGKKMLASYYGRTLEGHPMANGQPFDADDYTAAHKSLPFGTELDVSYAGESVRVTVTDRGPYVAGRDLDLSLAAAQEIHLAGTGEAAVRVEVV
jgi:rare lipoprotein A (peptidoglycan hydrolase)